MKRKRRRASIFRRLRWRVEDSLYGLAEAIFVRASAATVYRWGEALGAMCWKWAPRFRRIITRNLRVVFAGAKSPAELEALARETMLRAGGNLLSSIRTAAVPLEEVLRCVTVEGQHYFDEISACEKGVVIVLPHMGNWELMAQIGPAFAGPRPAATHYRPLNNPILNARIAARRSRTGMTLFSKKTSALSMAAFLRQGGAIGILGDQRVGKAGIIVPYFGRATSCTPLPELLTKRAGAKAVAVSLRTVEAGRWVMQAHPIAEPYDTAACMAGLEQAMLASITDVFWLQDRWAGVLDRNHAIAGNPSATESTNEKPQRFLVMTGDEFALHRSGDIEPLPMAPPPLTANVAAWVRFLQAIDDADPLPLDAMYASADAPVALEKACRHFGLPFGRPGVRPR